MAKRNGKQNGLVLVAVACSLMVLFGCASQKPFWGDPDAGLTLTYRAEEGTLRQYNSQVKVIQDMAMIGQKNESLTDLTFSGLAKPKDGENLVLNITVDQLDVSLSTMQGDFSPDTSGIVGKSFDMTLSPLGDELDVAGAGELSYETSPFTKSSLLPSFARIFPDLPPHPVKQGDTWTSKSSTTTEENGTTIRTPIEYAYTLAGYETVAGKACAKITGKMTGTLEGEGSQMGSDFTLNGDLTGFSTWLFAYEEGGLVGHELEFSGNITIDSAMGGFPMKLITTEKLDLIQ